MILTRRGWLEHSDVRVGDETIGYNPATGNSEWTRITAVHHYDDAPLVRLGNSRWHATTTPEHRWLNLPRITDPAPGLPDSCPLCPWPDMPPLPPPPSSCPKCGWRPKAPGGVPLHLRRAHGVIGANASGRRKEGFRRRGKTTEGGLRIHLARVHGIKGAGQSKSTYATEATWIRTAHVRSRDRLLLAAPARTGEGLPVTVTEAAILGWIAGDGHVEKYVDKPRGRKKPTMSIAQSKPTMAEKLTVLLADVPCAHYVDHAPRLSRVNKKPVPPRHQWRLDYDYAQDLMRRAGHPKEQAVEQVLAMSAEQREAWLEAIIDAEGHRSIKPGYSEPQVTISQTLGPVHDAIVLAIYLTGHRPRVLAHTRNHERWSDSDSIHPNNPVVTGAFLKREDVGRGPVWCVTTELGTWTAEEDGHVFLTGDSDINAQFGTPSKGLQEPMRP